MPPENHRFTRTARCACLAAAIAALAGCGGGGDTPTPPAPPPAPLSVSGTVIDGPISGATVCLDLDSDGSCEAGEPTSSATDAQGRYTITGLTSSQLTAPLLAVIPADAVDMSNPGVPIGTAFRMGAPAGKGAVISPVTHLVQAGIGQGLTLAAAEAAVAAQLQVAAASLYNDYTASSAGDNAALAASVPVIVSALKSGSVFDIQPATTGTPGYSVREFRFTNADNYYLRYFYSPNVPDASGQYTFFDLRQQRIGGVAPTAGLYSTALIATPQGWLQFDGNTANLTTGGSPSQSTYNRGYTYVGVRTDIDVGGMPVSQVIAMTQDMTVNTQATVTGVDAAALTGTMPAGAQLRRVQQINTATPIGYRENEPANFPAGVTSLATLIAKAPVATAAPSPALTASMGGLRGDSACATTVANFCPQERLRVGFAASGNAVTWYLCDYVPSTGLQSNCQEVGTGTYSLGTAVDGITPIMTFAGLPPQADVQSFTRVFVERNGKVYQGFQDKPQHSTTTRLNRSAFEALAGQLGITPPAIAAAPSQFAGTWSASYSGGDTGACAAITINTAGQISGSCTSTGMGGSFAVSGHVAADGSAQFSGSGSTSSGASFVGNFAGNGGSGTWSLDALGGSWSATKQ